MLEVEEEAQVPEALGRTREGRSTWGPWTFGCFHSFHLQDDQPVLQGVPAEGGRELPEVRRLLMRFLTRWRERPPDGDDLLLPGDQQLLLLARVRLAGQAEVEEAGED